MRFNFRKISAMAASVLLASMTVGVAAAANYPAPFVSGGSADVAIVYGTGEGVSQLDIVEAGNLQSNLQSYMGASAGGVTDATLSGDIVALDSSSTRIWLNTSLNTAKSTLTKTDLPVVLADNTFSGDVDAKLTSTIKILAGAAAGGANSNKVIFAKQPKSSDDPTAAISLGSSAQPLYNASVTMKAVGFNETTSKGENIVLFGRNFVVSTATDADTLVLFSSSEELNLVAGGASPVTSATVDIDGTSYTVELVTGTSTTATIAIGGDSKEVSEGASKKIGGIDVAVKSVTESTALDTVTATILVGSNKLTFENGATVTQGSNNDPIDGTTAYLVGGANALTELAVAVYRPDSSTDVIAPGEAFVDPVFGSFKVEYTGLSSDEDDTNRAIITIANSGDDDMSLTLTDDSGNEGTVIFAHNASNRWRLADDTNKSIAVREAGNVSEDDLIILGNEDYGHILKITQLYNNTGTDYTNDKVKLQDVISGDTYETVFTAETDGTIAVDGKTYTVELLGTGESGNVTFKYPTSDSAAGQLVVYPTVKTANGALVALYEPLNATDGAGYNSQIDLSDIDGKGTDCTGLKFPDGDGYTTIAISHSASNATASNWTIDSTILASGPAAWEAAQSVGTNKTVTIGQLTYNISLASGTVNATDIFLIDPEAGSAHIDNPAVIIFEGQDNNNAYDTVVVDLEGNAASMGSSTNGVGINDILFSTNYGLYSESLASDSDITKEMDWYGIITTLDAGDSDQKTATISIPSAQTYANVYIGELGGSVSGGTSTAGAATSLGNVLVKDDEVSSVSTKNLIIVGGSCINSAAATVIGGAYCGAGFTDATNVGAGEFLLKSSSDSTVTSKVALVVAGYDAADTVAAATYLRTQTVDTSMSYKGTSSTSAEVITEAA